MASSNSKFSSPMFYFLAVLIIYLPFQRLLEQILLFHGFSESLTFWALHWYEPLIVVALIVNFLLAIKNKSLRFNWIILLSITLIALSAVSIFIFSPGISRGIEGFRFTAFFLLVFLAAYWSNLPKPQISKLISIYLIMAGIFALWGIIERFMPANYLVSWGLIAANSDFGYGAREIDGLLQIVTGIGGPNQLGSYLLPAIFISLNKMSNIKDKKYYYWILIFLCTVAVVLTLSRSAWVGLYVGMFVAAVILIKQSWLKIASIIFLIIFALVVAALYLYLPNKILTHSKSNTQHQSALQMSVDEIKSRTTEPVKLIFGAGVGTAGPVTLKYGEGLIPESWYLQLALEIGIIGLIFWLSFILFLLTELYRKDKGLFLGLVAVSTAAFFLHTWSDNPAIAITLFILIGASIFPQQEKKLYGLN